MSLFSTITHGEAAGLKKVSPRGVGAFALILAAGMALGYGISSIEVTAEPEVGVSQGIDLAEFLRINTAAYQGLAPMSPEVPQVNTQAKVDPFQWANIGSYDGLTERWQVDAAFALANTQLPVYGPYDRAEAARFDRFLTINTTDYAGLTQPWQVDPAFIEANTNLGTTYTEPKSGPH